MKWTLAEFGSVIPLEVCGTLGQSVAKSRGDKIFGGGCRSKPWCPPSLRDMIDLERLYLGF